MHLSAELQKRVLVLDGAMGTAIQNEQLSVSDFGGSEYEGCNEFLVLTRPEIISQIHKDYLKAGCDIIETNTFGGTPLVLEEYGLSERASEINYLAARLARAAADQFSTPDHSRFVAGSIGPTTKAISVTGGISFSELKRHFEVQSKALIEGGVDYLLVETCQDTRNIKAALLGIENAFRALGKRIPVAVSGTIEPTGTMLAGQSVEALYASLSHYDLLYLGLNCATGPEFMTDAIRSLSKLSRFPIACVPNAGLPDENGHYLETPQMVGRILSRFIQEGWINLVGGCCGTTAPHIAELARIARGRAPRTTDSTGRSFLSGIDYVEVTDDVRPIIVGERTNVIGSKKFKTLIVEEKFEEASEIARAQIKNGAQIVDVCLANPDRDEHEDMRCFLEAATKKIRAPLMIDSTDASVIELALTYCQGKAIINSINLEDGEERFEKVVPLAKTYGAALVVGTIDDDPHQGMGIQRNRKLEIAQRSFALLTQKYGVPEEDIYWDPLVFPCATGDAQYVGSAVETIEGLKLLKSAFPKSKTILGISNISFGLPASGREVLNSVFLYHCVLAGLDLAIVNSEKLERYASIPDNEKKLAENLLFQPDEKSIAEFAAHFREKKPNTGKKKEDLPLLERLPRYIIEGTKDGLIDDLNQALQDMRPLEIINGPLMKGMDEVGRLFNSNQLIVAEVLQSAESMKAAVAHLQKFMEKSETSSRGKVLLATVKGDVHDIGKNLVEIILSNNGFEVINLGIKIPPEQLIQATREHQPDMIGLSGLLVKSAQQMVITADDLSRAGISLPILVGGAALSSTFVDRQIAKAYTTGFVAYAKDAMQGLDLAKTIVEPERLARLKEETHSRRALKEASILPTRDRTRVASTGRSIQVPVLTADELPEVPDFRRHVLKNTPLQQVWKYVNPLMLFGRHLGVKGSSVRMYERNLNELGQKDPKALEIWETIHEMLEEYGKSPYLRPAAVYQYFKASSDGENLFIYSEGNDLLEKFTFPRQNKENGLCLADYSNPHQGDASALPNEWKDTVAFFVVTVGQGVRELSEQLKSQGKYLKSHAIQALALECAEGYAELLHSQLRKAWGFEDSPEMTMMQRFQAKYRGKRYSFGYPACPRLDDQELLWRLLRPEEIGVQLTEGFMMDPESSVSALVFHHAAATYFSVGDQDPENRSTL